MKNADFRANSGILERLEVLVPGLERWVRYASGKMSWISTGQGGIPSGGNYLTQHFSSGVLKNTGHEESCYMT